jgi:hypothetical protein
MSETIILTLTEPRDPRDCLQQPLLPLCFPGGHLSIASLAVEHLYLADINDDPDREEEYDKGLNVWASCVRQLFEWFRIRLGGSGAELRYIQHGNFPGSFWNRAASKESWEIAWLEGPEPEKILSLSTFGADPIVWTSIGDLVERSEEKVLIPTDQLLELVRSGRIRWWMTHGYKEPYLVIYDVLSFTALASALQSGLSLPVLPMGETKFIPHRVRMHQRQERL